MAVTTKALGPAVVGGRALPRWATGVIAVTAPALLSALVVTSVLADGQRWAVGAQTAGVGGGRAAALSGAAAPLEPGRGGGDGEAASADGPVNSLLL